jgi:short-subunit dehydrogenase
MKNILIIGATSAIATACARRWAPTGARFFLTARNAERLQQVAADLGARGATRTACGQLDIDDLDAHAALLQRVGDELGDIDIVLIAPGTLPDQQACEQDPAVAVREFNTNAVSLIALLTPLANRMEAQERGVIAVISSVAGDRGRPSNYLYGSAKAALSAFCEGLRARLAKSGVHLLTIKPGFVATPMTAGLPLSGPLVATTDKVASDIVRAIEKRKDVLYTPWFWAGIMLIIRSIPQRVFKRLSL